PSRGGRLRCLSASQPPRSSPGRVPRPPSVCRRLQRSLFDDSRTPIVELLPHRQIQEALRRDDTVEGADPARQLEQLPTIGADELDENVVLAGRDDYVAGFLPLGDLVRDRLGGPPRTDSDHRHRVEAEPEWVRHARDLENVVVAEPPVAGPNRRLGNADLSSNAPERFAPVFLQRFDDALVDVVERPCRPDRTAILLTAQCVGILADRLALRQLRTVGLV